MFLPFFFQAEGGMRYLVRSRGLGDVYKRQVIGRVFALNVLLCALAGLSVALAMPLVDIALIALSLIHI